MPAGWSAKSLIPVGLGGFSGGSGVVSRGSLAGGLAPTAPMNTINSTMPGGTGVPPFVSSALNPFLSAVLGGQQPQASQAPAAVPNINVADIVRAQNERLRINEAIRAQGAANWNLGKLQSRVDAIPTSFGGMAAGGLGPQRADLQQRMLGFESQLGRAQAGIFGQPMSPMGGWSNTFAIPTY